MPITSRRGPSAGGWSRLKPAPRDDLTVYGFPSKGETRLNDFKAQENFFNVIFERYMRFCNDSRDSLADEFAKLGMADSTSTSTSTRPSPPSSSDPQHPAPTTASPSQPQTPSSLSTNSTLPRPVPSPELTLIHTAMRKLRESIISSHRTDPFARSTYLFIIRATLLTQSWAAYMPAISHLLSHIAPSSPLSPSDARAVSTWRILDAACRIGDLAGALRLRAVLDIKDSNVDAILRAYVHGEWGAWWGAKRRVDGHARAIMEMGEERVRRAGLKVIARAYLSVEKEFVERVAGRAWGEIVKGDGVGWELVEGDGGKGGMIVVRKVKGR